MLERLVHRGPDDRGEVSLEGAWLGHRRLSIVDVAGGHQPLRGGSEDHFFVGNGEIYNHAALRARLGDDRFRTASDNEVALHVVERDGPEGLAELNGMFAFVMASGDEGFLAARDPVGIKPLYWARHADGVAFASEMAAFDAALHSRIEAFPPGHYWTPGGGLVRFAPPVSSALRRPRRARSPPRTCPPTR